MDAAGRDGVGSRRNGGEHRPRRLHGRHGAWGAGRRTSRAHVVARSRPAHVRGARTDDRRLRPRPAGRAVGLAPPAGRPLRRRRVGRHLRRHPPGRVPGLSRRPDRGDGRHLPHCGTLVRSTRRPSRERGWQPLCRQHRRRRPWRAGSRLRPAARPRVAGDHPGRRARQRPGRGVGLVARVPCPVGHRRARAGDATALTCVCADRTRHAAPGPRASTRDTGASGRRTGRRGRADAGAFRRRGAGRRTGLEPAAGSGRGADDLRLQRDARHLHHRACPRFRSGRQNLAARPSAGDVAGPRAGIDGRLCVGRRLRREPPAAGDGRGGPSRRHVVAHGALAASSRSGVAVADDDRARRRLPAGLDAGRRRCRANAPRHRRHLRRQHGGRHRRRPRRGLPAPSDGGPRAIGSRHRSGLDCGERGGRRRSADAAPRAGDSGRLRARRAGRRHPHAPVGHRPAARRRLQVRSISGQPRRRVGAEGRHLALARRRPRRRRLGAPHGGRDQSRHRRQGGRLERRRHADAEAARPRAAAPARGAAPDADHRPGQRRDARGRAAPPGRLRRGRRDLARGRPCRRLLPRGERRRAERPPVAPRHRRRTHASDAVAPAVRRDHLRAVQPVDCRHVGAVHPRAVRGGA